MISIALPARGLRMGNSGKCWIRNSLWQVLSFDRLLKRHDMASLQRHRRRAHIPNYEHDAGQASNEVDLLIGTSLNYAGEMKPEIELRCGYRTRKEARVEEWKKLRKSTTHHKTIA